MPIKYLDKDGNLIHAVDSSIPGVSLVPPTAHSTVVISHEHFELLKGNEVPVSVEEQLKSLHDKIDKLTPKPVKLP